MERRQEHEMPQHLTYSEAVDYMAKLSSPAESARIEEHYLICPTCVQLLKAVTEETFPPVPRSPYHNLPLPFIVTVQRYGLNLAAIMIIGVAISVVRMSTTRPDTRLATLPWEIELIESPTPLANSDVDHLITNPRHATSAKIPPLNHARTRTGEAIFTPSGPPRLHLFDPPHAQAEGVIATVVLDIPELLEVTVPFAPLPFDVDAPEVTPFPPKQNRVLRLFATLARPFKALVN